MVRIRELQQQLERLSQDRETEEEEEETGPRTSTARRPSRSEMETTKMLFLMDFIRKNIKYY